MISEQRVTLQVLPHGEFCHDPRTTLQIVLRCIFLFSYCSLGFGGVLVTLKRAGFNLADVQSGVLLLSCMHTTTFSTDQQLRRLLVCLPMCH